MHALKGKNVLVMGLGGFGGGSGVARFCVAQGARVTVTDFSPEEKLHDSLKDLAGLDVRYRLDGHDLNDFTHADLIVVNPAVDRRNNKFLDAARLAGVELTSEIDLLIERIPRERVIGVTGTAGKSTTVAMIGHILAHALGPDRVHIGGNIGGSLLNKLGHIRADNWIVLELSSFMLEALAPWSPHIAVVTNISDNHLDRHGTLEDYTRAKKRILLYQTPGDHAILGSSVAGWRTETRASVSVIDRPLDAGLAIPGVHNRLNGAVAVAACERAAITRECAIEAVRTFPGLPHRLEFVLEHAGVRFYNDSKSTTPESALLALDAFDPGRTHLILGGYDKKSDMSTLATRAAKDSASVYTVGHTGDALAAAIEAHAVHCPVHRCGTLDIAAKEAVRNALWGQVILLSPACASWDQFPNYEARGRLFRELALRYTTEA